MTAENSTKKLRTEKSKREEETALVIKTILQLVIMAAVAVLFPAVISPIPIRP